MHTVKIKAAFNLRALNKKLKEYAANDTKLITKWRFNTNGKT